MSENHLRSFRCEADTVSGVAVALIKVPGDSGVQTRLIESGEGWFESHHVGDVVTKVEVVDVDGILAPAGNVLGAYHDVDAPEANQGIYFPPDGIIRIAAVQKPGKLIAGLYLRITAQKGDLSADTFRVNIRWAQY